MGIRFKPDLDIPFKHIPFPCRFGLVGDGGIKGFRQCFYSIVIEQARVMPFGFDNNPIGCHDKLYYNENLVREMARQTNDCRIPSELVPHCPVCGGKIDVHVRKDRYFVQDSQWYASYERYQYHMGKACDGNALLLELGVGYNTPTIIRFPFERLAAQRRSITLVRINRDYPNAHKESFHLF